MIVVGLMSGTSADGTDVAIVEIEGEPPALHWRLRHFASVPHPAELQTAVLRAMRPETGTVDKLCTLNVALGEQFAEAALAATAEAGLELADVGLIGSHGQTVWHDPDGVVPATLQLGEAAVIAERTGVAVVSNFRPRDIAAGGQGAPLVGYVDALLLAHPTKVRAAQNIGGIANVTFLPPHSRPDLRPFAFDTGPGNALLNETAVYLTNGRWQYDHDGQLAAAGQVHSGLLEWLRQNPYYQRHPPKTTGRELFSRAYAQHIWALAAAKQMSDNDLMATLTALTAHTIADAYRHFLPLPPDEMIISGGGAQNPVLMRLLAEALPEVAIVPAADLGLPGEAKEAIAFAILAYETWNGRCSNLPSATGAKKAVILGQITPV